MPNRNDLTLEQKINLIKENEAGSCYRDLRDKFNVSIGAVSNILKRKREYMSDYETNLSKNVKRKTSHDFSQSINESVYEWFVAQRAKKIPVSGPILQTYARKVARELDGESEFKASNGWLERFRTRYNVNFRVISGEAAAVCEETVADWKSRLATILEEYNPGDVYNCDETGLYYKMMPDRSLVVNKEDCVGGKKSKERFTVLLCANWAGNDKLKPVVIGKAAKPRCFKNIDMKKLPVTWYHNRTAWMNSFLFTDWLQGLDLMMQKQKRKILLFLDNAPVHPVDVKLENITLKFFPANTTAVIQPMDQGVIRTFKAYYRQQLIQHIITSSTGAQSADDVVITALDAVCWIEIAWKSVSETTLQNTFRKAGFMTPSAPTDLPPPPHSTSSIDEVISAQEQESLKNLDKVLRHVSISGTSMSATDFVDVDADLPAFNEWNDDSEKLISIHVIPNEDPAQNEDFEVEQPPSVTDAIQLLRRLRLLTTARYPELHSLLSQFQSKLIDIYLDSNNVKQRSILDFFQSDGSKTKNFL
ncbi:unnamed protein product [Adineta ricciae]|uniref:HTH CENPB-type domain-containing protein n=1 Tax=Adineta ricciae TaxID=249248 RepID=A0A816CF27_ADIRI|nr:unnamed protein product [Adineta ricciae]